MFTIEWMDLLHFHNNITINSPLIYTSIVQIPCDVIYCWYGHRYAYINCSGLDPKIHGFYLGSIQVDSMSNDLGIVKYEL